MTDRYGVMGNPVSHSQSPTIHAQFAAQTGQSIRYDALPVPVDGFAGAVRDFGNTGGKGLNVTLPFKEEAHRLMDELTPAAERGGAVNTIWFDPDGRILGDNTDGPGLVVDLTVNHGVAVRGRRVLLVGAGGAARGVAGPLLDEAPGLLMVANRTEERAVSLARAFASWGNVVGCGLDALGSESFDIIINATSASLAAAVPALPESTVTAGTLCYDMMYGPGDTEFVRWGNRVGAARSVDGLGMLVEQAALSFARWRGVRPRTPPVIARLRSLQATP